MPESDAPVTEAQGDKATDSGKTPAADGEQKTTQVDNQASQSPTPSGQVEADSTTSPITTPNVEYVKHPLQNEWQLWFWKNIPNGTWEDGLLRVAKFKTVEDFWSLYHHIETASRLSHGSDYSLFKDDIQPMWEDERNREGGRWLFTIPKMFKPSDGESAKLKHGELIESMWLEVLLCLIGEAFGDHSDQICGAVLNIRPKQDKIAIWTSNCKDRTAVNEIGKLLKERTKFHDFITYESHKETATKKSSTAKFMMKL